MDGFAQGFLDAMRVAGEAAALATSVVMLMATVELFPNGYYWSSLFFGAGSCVLLWHSLNRVIASWRKTKVTP